METGDNPLYTRLQAITTWNKHCVARSVKGDLIQQIVVDIESHSITFEQISTLNPSVKLRTFRDLKAGREEHFGYERLTELRDIVDQVVLANTSIEAA